MRKSIISLSLLLAIGIYSCKKNVDSENMPAASSVPVLPESMAKYYTGNTGNTNANAKATLGRVLFYEKRLSLNNAVSCGSCHKQAYAFADNAAFSRGYENRMTARNSLAIENLNNSFSGNLFDFRPSLFWDGRENSIQNLVLRPITNHVEMGIEDPETLPGKLQGLPYYEKLFTDAYGDAQITTKRISECIGYFIGAITADSTKFDQYSKGRVELTALEQEGYSLFISKYNCTRCHNIFPGGYNGRSFFDIGLDAVAKDKGRGEFEGPSMDGKFKTPNLRNVALTAPYMHDGRFATLKDVLNHYSRGINNSVNLSEGLRDENEQPLRMNISEHEQDALVAFLSTLTDYNMVTDKKFSDPFVTQ